MDVLKRSWAQILALLSGLSRAERWLIISLLVIIIGALVSVMFWAKEPNRYPITGLAPEDVSQAMARLQMYGIDAKLDGNRILVEKSQFEEAVLSLNSANLMSEDISKVFSEFITNQSPWTTDAQAARQAKIYLEKALGKNIKLMPFVRSATVYVGMPKQEGFGQTHKKPSATVTIGLEGNEKLTNERVKSIAAMISGTIAEMDEADVTVVDLNGRRWRVNEDEGLDPNESLAHQLRQERKIASQIENILHYIPGVVVEVSITTNPVARKETNRYAYGEQVELENETELRERKNTTDSGQVGVRPNTSLNVRGTQANGSEEKQEKQRTKMGAGPLQEVSHIVYRGQEVQLVSATVMVPRSFYVSVWKSRNPDKTDAPTAEDISGIQSEQETIVQRSVKSLIENVGRSAALAAGGDPSMYMGDVFVGMGEDSVMMAVKAGDSGITSQITSFVDSGYAKHVGGLVLGVVAIGLMLWMVRNATKPEKLPSVEELAGIPPDLPTEEDLVGEVDEHEATMAGYELDEDELRSRRIAEQISDLIKANPNEAANIFGKWVRTDD